MPFKFTYIFTQDLACLINTIPALPCPFPILAFFLSLYSVAVANAIAFLSMFSTLTLTDIVASDSSFAVPPPLPLPVPGAPLCS